MSLNKKNKIEGVKKVSALREEAEEIAEVMAASDVVVAIDLNEAVEIITTITIPTTKATAAITIIQATIIQTTTIKDLVLQGVEEAFQDPLDKTTELNKK
jgi:hypothetical protein